MDADQAFVNIDRIGKHYAGVVALADVSLQISRGEFVTLLGPSGSGKTTTLNIVAGFTDQTSGEVYVEGRSLSPVPPHRRNIGMVFQRYTLFPHMNVFDNVAFPLSIRGVDSGEIRKAVEKVIALVQLSGLASRRPGDLSGGQQQRVALARALVYQPRILLMDEPLSALDKKLREELQVEIRHIHKELGVTVIYVTHDQEEALRLSDRIAIFDQGRIVQVGTGRELYESPASEFVASFVGNSNFVEGEVERITDGGADIRLPGGDLLSTAGAFSIRPRSPVRLMVRPERLEVRGAAEGDGTGVINGTVVDVTYLGDLIHYEVLVGTGQKLSARVSAGSDREAFTPGNKVSLKASPSDIYVFTRS